MSNIITFAALYRLPHHELRALYRQTLLQAAQSAPGSPKRQVAIANLDTIQRVLNAHHRPSGPSL